jgi:hypothetical protein
MRKPTRSSIALAAMIAAIAVLLVAGLASTTFADSPDDPVATPVTPGTQPPAWDDPSAATPVETRPGMADVRARGFDRSTVNDDGTVTILFVSGVEPCAVLDHVQVDDTDDAVTVTLFEGHDPSAGDVACIEIGVLKSVTITLDQPLDGRPIVDGAS